MTEAAAVDLLYVEDDPNDAELTLRSLRRAGIDRTIRHARDGVEALEYLYGEHPGGAAPAPRLVLLDLKLPRVSGLEVLRRIRAEERTRLTPVVILTSSREPRDIAQAYALGANGFVVKPVDFDRYEAAVAGLGRFWLEWNEAPVA